MLFEFLLLAGFGYLYYLFQKRRIIRRDKIEISEIIWDLSVEHKTNDYFQKLQTANNDQDFHRIEELLNQAPDDLAKEDQEAIKLLLDKITFHTKNKS